MKTNETDEVRNLIISVVSSITDLDAKSIKTDVPFSELGLDSLDRTEVLLVIECKFNFSMDEEQVFKLTTIDDCVKFITEHHLKLRSK